MNKITTNRCRLITGSRFPLIFVTSLIPDMPPTVFQKPAIKIKRQINIFTLIQFGIIYLLSSPFHAKPDNYTQPLPCKRSIKRAIHFRLAITLNIPNHLHFAPMLLSPRLPSEKHVVRNRVNTY